MSSFSLKILATILMIIDHLAYFWYDFSRYGFDGWAVLLLPFSFLLGT